MKSSWNCAEEYYNVNQFCYGIRDRLNVLFQSTMGMKRSQNMSNVGPACADKTDVIEECRRQLYEKKVYNQLTQEEANQLIRVIKKHLSNIVNKHTIRGNCSKRESEFLLSNLNKFNIPHFYIIWKILKIQM